MTKKEKHRIARDIETIRGIKTTLKELRERYPESSIGFTTAIDCLQQAGHKLVIKLH